MKLFIITGTCGAGKSTMKDELAARLDPDRYACVDSDETGLNWWDYAGTEREEQYGSDTLWEAFRISGSCLQRMERKVMQPSGTFCATLPEL